VIVNGFPLPQVGICDADLIRSMLEVEFWFKECSNKGRDIEGTRKKLYNIWFGGTEPMVRALLGAGPPLAPAAAGTPSAPSSNSIRMRMPKDMTGIEEVIFVSPGYTNMPSTMKPCQLSPKLKSSCP
jgi:hypothetical protein